VCGINGLYGLKESVLNAEQIITRMNNSLKHRGPDDGGVFISDNIALGHRRLSIIDLSAAGHQPMYSFDKRYTIVYNGELYNFKELKFELQRIVSGSGSQAYLFQTNTDTEVILAAYARWGADCLNKFNGMYAFAIWDNEKKELFIARDRLGIKPLYYFFTDGIFAFSSEIRALLSSDLIPKKLDQNSLVDYLRYQTVHAPNTIIKGVKMLMPGSYITISNGNVKEKKYWQIDSLSKEQAIKKDYKEICKDVNDLLTKAVQRRLIADVPFGAFLSGGIDSSAVVGLMSKVSSEKIKTFSITFDESEYSEAKYAQLIAKKFNTDHHEIKLTPTDFLNELPNSLKAMDHPSGDGPNTYIVSKATKNAGITMALSGLGGDELFAGYAIFKRSLELNKKKWLNVLPTIIRKSGGTLLKKAKPSIESNKVAELLSLSSLNFNNTYPLSRQVLLDEQIKSILKQDILPLNSVHEIISSFNKIDDLHQISQVSCAEVSSYMQNVLLRDTDQMSMAHALEVRVPFLDYTLVEYVLNLSDQYKYPVTPKKLLIDSLGELLPDEIVNRPKMGFVLPWNNWMKNELKSFCEEKIISLSKRKSFNEAGLTKLWNDFMANKPTISWSRIWILVVLENWLQTNSIDE